MTARPVSVARPRPGLRVIPGGAARAPRITAWTLFTVAVVAAFFGLISSRTALDRSAFVVEELDREIAREEARYQELRLEVARLQAPQRVLDLARQMGMVFPEEVKTVVAPGVVVAEDRSLDPRWTQLKTVLTGP